ncbi:MAC/perforin domain-containing protein [Crocosphaera sp.]|uniref:MAC/perforin domain-containing protein n=1 Tax=Crocosphaera sp. TaxID=2729996 RepID=UPI003F1FA628|nr:MAC/perforin domain-containing protein [Crocosphaera sp.]
MSSNSNHFPTNLTFLGRCYDILELDPLDTARTAKTDYVFDFNIGASQTIPGEHGIVIPLGTNFSPGESGGIESETEILFTVSDLQEMLGSTFKIGSILLSLVTKIIPFSLSANYKKFKRELTEEKQIYTVTKREFIDFNLELDLASHHLSVRETFHNAVVALPSNDASDNYQSFINKWGTHFAQLVRFGGLAYQTIHLDASRYQKLLEQGVNISGQASGIFNSNFNLSSNISLEESLIQRSEKIRFLGGTPNNNLNQWFESIREDPAPVEMALLPLYELFTPQFFPTDSAIAQKQQLMKQAVITYLERESDKPKWAIWESPVFGGNGGSHFSDANKITEQTKATSVKVRIGSFVDQVSITLNSGESLKHGGDGGDEKTLTLATDEYISSVTVTVIDKSFLDQPVGFSGRFLSSIEIKTNKNNSLLAGQPDDRSQIVIKAPEKHQIVGFHGRAGSLLDQLGVVAIPLL